jgi:hypothetical protein
MFPIMEEIAKCFLCNLSEYKILENNQVLSVSVTSIDKLKVIIEYFNTYSLLGIKYNDYMD